MHKLVHSNREERYQPNTVQIELTDLPVYHKSEEVARVTAKGYGWGTTEWPRLDRVDIFLKYITPTFLPFLFHTSLTRSPHPSGF